MRARARGLGPGRQRTLPGCAGAVGQCLLPGPLSGLPPLMPQSHLCPKNSPWPPPPPCPPWGARPPPGPNIPARSAPWLLPPTLGSDCWTTEQVGERTSVVGGAPPAVGSGPLKLRAQRWTEPELGAVTTALSSLLPIPSLLAAHLSKPHFPLRFPGLIWSQGPWSLCAARGMSPAFLARQPLCCFGSLSLPQQRRGGGWGECAMRVKGAAGGGETGGSGTAKGLLVYMQMKYSLSVQM